MSAVLLKLFYDGAAQGFAGGVKSRTILLHPINTPQALIHNMAGMRFSENLHPTHSPLLATTAWKSGTRTQNYTHTHSLTSTSLYQSSRPAPSFTFLSLSPAHTRIFSYTRETDFTAAVSVKTQWLSVQPVVRIWRSVCSNVWGTIAAKNERRRKTVRKEKR